MSATAAAVSATTAACQAVSLSDWRNLLAVIWDFLRLSLFSLGGGNTLLNEYHHMAVEQYCWLSSRQFADIYAIAEASPGPSSMIVGLRGDGGCREGGSPLGAAQRPGRRDIDSLAFHRLDGGGRLWFGLHVHENAPHARAHHDAARGHADARRRHGCALQLRARGAVGPPLASRLALETLRHERVLRGHVRYSALCAGRASLPVAGLDGLRRATAVPQADHERTLVVGINQTNAVAEHQSQLMTESGTWQNVRTDAGIPDMDGHASRNQLAIAGLQGQGLFEHGAKIQPG